LTISVISGFRTFTVTVVSPVPTAHHSEGLGDRFVEHLRRHVELVRGVVRVMDMTVQALGATKAIYHIRHLFAYSL
jgi:GTPase involved in cell partitioning and DNA repair